ncbi:hypothetical protein ALI144C_31710 [Actinosynnema sp. ALI-1.44]|uniref:hypothetical protein n=1 Tax=Actinosynnema sp. ALI-1.44 TaxID=1933779 RepID=UPI00097C6782|nr:hypothetical protein [Actinosynnema sp. ALI-1.44]ONI77967.1 hypothetical protein ALI144C_31710 [Actinosynnema sp. ALI-1.44]
MTSPAPRAMTPADCLDMLPEPTLGDVDATHNGDLFRVDLRRAVRAIAELDHVTESALVRAVVTAVLGEVPESDD